MHPIPDHDNTEQLLAWHLTVVAYDTPDTGPFIIHDLSAVVKSNTKGCTGGEGTAYLSRASDFTPVFNGGRIAQS